MSLEKSRYAVPQTLGRSNPNSHLIRLDISMHRKLILFLCFSLVVVPVLADEKRHFVKTFADGGIEIDGQYFGSQLEFQQSELFEKGGFRCASQKRSDLPILKDASNCTMNSTTIDSDYNPNSGGVYTIPVVFHVIKKIDGTGNISLSLINSQLDILNEDFRALPGSLGANGTDTKIEFELATVDPDGLPTTGINYYTNDAYFTDPGPNVFNDMKSALNWDPTRYLNIYTNDASGYLGYATFPQQDAGDYDDGVVLLHSSVGRNAPSGGIYDQGRTGTHEVGHYLGLFHTFEGGCGSASAPYTTGDRIADTNRQASETFGCPAGATSCGGSLNPIENYMNYTQDTCMERFTLEQANRMRCSIENYRAICTAPPATPNHISGPNNDLCQGTIETYWTSQVPGTFNHYRWEVVSPQFTWGRITPTNVLSLSGHYFSPGSYTFRVRAENSCGNSGWRFATLIVLANTDPACGGCSGRFCL